MRVHSTSPAFFALWLLTITRVFGGAALLWLLGAPGWAVAAWLMLHVRFKLKASQPACERPCEQLDVDDWQILSRYFAKTGATERKKPAKKRSSRE